MKNTLKILLVCLAFVLLIFGATIGYIILLDVGFVDALYMTVITITTVGYTEVAVMTQAAKIFSIIVILVSVSTVAILASLFVRFISEGLVKETWRRKRMQKEIAEMKDHIILCGAGETGMHIVKLFKRRQVPFVVIEDDDDVVQLLYDMNVHFVHGDATREDALENANIKAAKGLITSLAKDADNVFVVLTARGMNADLHIVSRAHEASSYKKLKRAGANNTVSPNEIGGSKMANMLLKPAMSHFMDHIIDTGNISIDMEEVSIGEQSEICNKTLQDAKISEKTGLIVLAIRKHKDDSFIFNPKADEILKAKDKMIVVGQKDQIDKLMALANA